MTLSLLPHFVRFFSDGELPGSPGSLATTFLSFGEFLKIFFYLSAHTLSLLLILVILFIVLNMAFAVSVLGFLIMHVSLVFGNTTTIEARIHAKPTYLNIKQSDLTEC